MLPSIIGWLIAFTIRFIRLTSIKKFENDPRLELQQQGQSYIYAVLHAMQFATIVCREPKTGAMVSASKDGDMLVPALTFNGVVPYRGSARSKGKDKGGMKALEQMVEHSQQGLPTYFAVDGPRGPRNHVHKGVAELARRSGACIIPTMAIPKRRKILTGTWDRTQIPYPFNSITCTFGAPIFVQDGETTNDLRVRITDALNDLEMKIDPVEAQAAQASTSARKAR